MSSDCTIEDVEAFAKSISGEPCGLVYHEPWENALATNCFGNVLSYKEEYGGNIKFGWTFHIRKSEYGDYMLATHHAVWLPAIGGIPIDITPFHQEQRHPLTEDDRVFMQLDSSATLLNIGGMPVSRPLRYFTNTKNKQLMSYVESLQATELADFNKHYDTTFIY